MVVRQCAQANDGILEGTDPELDTMTTENDSEMKKEAAERNLHRMGKVHDFLEMCISNNSSFCLKHPRVPDGSDGSDGTSYPLTENQTRPIAQATGRVAYLPCGGY